MTAEFDDIALPKPHIASSLDDTFDQAGIDALFGDNDAPLPAQQGLKAVIQSKLISQERLPMLEVIYERMVRSFSTSMRSITSDAIDVTLEDLSSARFGSFINNIPLPAMIGVFHVEQWENYGVIAVESALIYAVVDALLGGRRENNMMRIEGRAFTSIESRLVSRMLSLALKDLSLAFQPIAKVKMQLDRIETNPRFAAIAGPSNISSIAVFRVDIEGRGGNFTIALPYATIEPVRQRLLQKFMGEKLGTGSIWQQHMATELRKSDIMLDVLLGARAMPLGQVQGLTVGQTIRFTSSPDDALEVHCAGTPLGYAQIGQRRDHVAVRMLSDISKGF
jgi:flagellar motor switch protein FliM